jgi:ATP-dependent helicase/nuclease subunit B
MNRLADALTQVCRAHVLAEKWLIAPSLRVGYQWLDAVAFGGQPVLNTRVNTLKGLAIDLAGPVLAERKLTVASARCGAMIVDRIIGQLRLEGHAFLSRLSSGTGIAQAFHATIDSLRLAGVTGADLASRHFEDSGRGETLRNVLDAYLDQLHASQLIDYAELLQISITLMETTRDALPADAMLLVPQDAALNHLEERLMAAIPAEKLHRLAVDEPASQGSSAETDTELLCWILQPSEAPPLTTRKTVQIVQAIGEVNEVKQIFRQCLAVATRLDEVEILHTDVHTYVPLIYETMMSVVGDGDNGSEDLPVTFAEGIPTSYSRPGRALLMWIEWIANDYPQVSLLKMLRDGFLAVNTDKENVGFGRLASLFRQVPIRFGRERYLEKLADYQQHLEDRGQIQTAQLDDEGDEHSNQKAYRERRLQGLKVIKDLCASLLDASPVRGTGPLEILGRAKQFLDTLARKVNQLDQYAFHKLSAEIEDMQKWLQLGGGPSTFDAWDWLTALPGETRVLGSGPRPGCVHVAPMLSGGHTGRPHTFLVGLDDNRFPGAGFQDPLLLDSERRGLSSKLATATERLQKKLRDFARLLSRLRGQVTLSFCSHEVTEAREVFPSAVVLSAFRLISGQREGDLSDLNRWLAEQYPACSFAPPKEDHCLNEAEWWLWRLCGPVLVADAQSLVFHHFPHLARGAHAEERRKSSEFTEYDGRVSQAGPELDPAREPTSANRLQKIGTCPLAYFFEYGLGLQLPEDVKVDPARWLDNLAFGSLLHEVFEKFIHGLIERKQLPEYQRDLPLLRGFLQEKVDEYRRLYPPPSQSVFQRQCEQLEQIVATFLREEELNCRDRNCRPVYPEASLGMVPGEHGTPLDTPEPISLPLAAGRVLHLRGRMDRIDEIGSGAVRTFGIWDYKTGSTWKYTAADPFRQGRVLQPYLYVTMVAHRLREQIGAAADVAFFGFFFPGTKAGGARLIWTPDRLAQGKQILEWLCQVVGSGSFLATTDHERDCGYCDFQTICGDVATVTARSKQKLANPHNKILQPMRELRTNPLAGK